MISIITLHIICIIRRYNCYQLKVSVVEREVSHKIYEQVQGFNCRIRWKAPCRFTKRAHCIDHVCSMYYGTIARNSLILMPSFEGEKWVQPCKVREGTLHTTIFWKRITRDKEGTDGAIWSSRSSLVASWIWSLTTVKGSFQSLAPLLTIWNFGSEMGLMNYAQFVLEKFHF